MSQHQKKYSSGGANAPVGPADSKKTAAAAQPGQQTFDLLNFKGMFFEQEHQKYTCPNTGAHFEPKDLCRRLNLVKNEREKQELNGFNKKDDVFDDQQKQAIDIRVTQNNAIYLNPAKPNPPGERAPSLKPQFNNGASGGAALHNNDEQSPALKAKLLRPIQQQPIEDTSINAYQDGAGIGNNINGIKKISSSITANNVSNQLQVNLGGQTQYSQSFALAKQNPSRQNNNMHQKNYTQMDAYKTFSILPTQNSNKHEISINHQRKGSSIGPQQESNATTNLSYSNRRSSLAKQQEDVYLQNSQQQQQPIRLDVMGYQRDNRRHQQQQHQISYKKDPNSSNNNDGLIIVDSRANSNQTRPSQQQQQLSQMQQMTGIQSYMTAGAAGSVNQRQLSQNLYGINQQQQHTRSNTMNMQQTRVKQQQSILDLQMGKTRNNGGTKYQHGTVSGLKMPQNGVNGSRNSTMMNQLMMTTTSKIPQGQTALSMTVGGQNSNDQYYALAQMLQNAQQQQPYNPSQQQQYAPPIAKTSKSTHQRGGSSLAMIPQSQTSYLPGAAHANMMNQTASSQNMMIIGPSANFHPRSPEKGKFVTAANVQQHQKRLSNIGGGGGTKVTSGMVNYIRQSSSSQQRQ